MSEIDWSKAPEWAGYVMQARDNNYWLAEQDEDHYLIKPFDSKLDAFTARKDGELVSAAIKFISIISGSEQAKKQPRYTVNGRDWIDECAESLTPEEFRGAMKFTIGKYLKRIGKKDDLQSELYKISDYAERWAEYERGLKDE